MTVLDIWTVYDHPSDFPDEFVARKFTVGDNSVVATGDIRRGATLREVREKLPLGLSYLARSEFDDAKIVEVWL